MSSIPNEFLCAIGLSLMKDPAIAPDGFTYERTAITEWLNQNAVSPMTRQPMRADQLRSNHALRQTIENWVAAHPMTAAADGSTAAVVPLFKDAPLSLTGSLSGGQLFLRLNVSDTERQPIVLLIIADNSGSMSEEASGGDGGESFGFTRLDLVKHTIRTIAAILGPNDMLGIVTYSTSAEVVLVPTVMNDAGRARVTTVLETVQPDSQTNIFDGIRTASLLANAPELAGRHIVGALLTDGFPNINPPRGIVPTLAILPTKNQWSLHTFGFGYKLDSKLLTEIAHWGQGLFGFIPDCSMVGTVFINFIANMLATGHRGQRIYYKVGDTVGSLLTGPVQIGQARDFVVPVVTGQSVTVSLDGVTWADATVATEPVFPAAHNSYLRALEELVNSAGSSSASLQAFRRALAFVHDTAVCALLADVKPSDAAGADEGQVSMAPRFWAKWGEHYLRSYLRAQQLQQALNFKDPGLQIYGGALFHEIQTTADSAFCTLPAPKPSSVPRADAHRGYAAAVAAPTTMATFHNFSGGCFAGHCRIMMADGTVCAIKDIAPGATVWTIGGPAVVRALVTCGSKLRTQPMVQLGDLCITPWHPIRLNNGLYVFPADMTPYQDRLIDTVYNLVLDQGHVVDCEGFLCITLGHGITEPVAAHAFFGTDAVIQDLMKLPGWSAGRPTFQNLTTVRDSATGTIVGWVDSP